MVRFQLHTKVHSAAPVFLSLVANTSLVTLDLSSLENITVDNTAFRVICHCLQRNRALKVLDISGWKFDLSLFPEMKDLMSTMLKNTNITHLSLAECEFNITVNDSKKNEINDAMRTTFKLSNQTIEELNLDSILILVNNIALKTRDVVSILQFSALKELDISEEAAPKLHISKEIKTSRENSTDFEDILVRDDFLLHFFQHLKDNFSNLEVLKMVNWKLKLSDSGQTTRQLKQCFKDLGQLKTISLNNVEQNDPQFLKCLIKYLPKLRCVSILRAELSEDQVPTLVKALKHKVKTGSSITLHTKHVSYEVGVTDKDACM